MRAFLTAVVVGCAAVSGAASAQWYGYGHGYGAVDPRVGTPYPAPVPNGTYAHPYGYGVVPPAAPAPYWQGQAVPPGTVYGAPAVPYVAPGQGPAWTENPANPGFVTPGTRQRCVGQGAARTCW